MQNKVVHISSAHSTFDIRIFKKECLSLSEEGYETVLVIPSKEDIRLNNVQIRGIRKFSGRGKRFFLNAYYAYKKAVKEDADLYHFHDPELMFYGFILKLKGKKVIYDIHENLIGQILHKNWLPRILRPLIKKTLEKIEVKLVPKYSGVIVVDNNLKEKYSSYSKNVATIFNYPIIDEFKKNVNFNLDRYKQANIVNFGGIREDRSISTIVDSLDLVASEEEFSVVVGGNNANRKLLRTVKKKKGWGYIDYKGQVERERMIEHLLKANISLILFSDKPNHHEVRSNRLFESMAAGLPVVTSNFPKWQNFIDENQCGIAVDSGDKYAIKEAIEYLLNNPQKAADMGRNGYKAVFDKYSWESQAKKLKRFYKMILN